MPHSPPSIIVPDDVLSLPRYSVRDPDAQPHYEDLFPPDYNPFPHMTPQQVTPLDPPPSYDSFFATAASTDSVEAPPNPWEDPYCWDIDAGSDLDL